MAGKEAIAFVIDASPYGVNAEDEQEEQDTEEEEEEEEEPIELPESQMSAVGAEG